MPCNRIPKEGAPAEDVLKRMRELGGQDADWRGGRTWSLVYHGGDETTDLLKRAYTMFFCENGLNPIAFPSLRRFEADVLRMAADMLGGGPETAGAMTSGGSESILMAVKTARDHGRAERGISDAEMVLPVTVHPAFEKAAHYFDVKAVHIPVEDDFRASVTAARDAVNERTVLMVGSAPGYPHGIIDPIEELALIAKENGILFHVDACLGGFLLPWLPKLGYEVPAFDFRVPGVTSMSADLHKYGFTAKGASTVLYRDQSLLRHQFFTYTDWPGGLYGSPSMTGTRPGGAIAAAWAALNFIGEDGYVDITRGIMDTSNRLKQGIESIDGLRILGNPPASVFAFTSEGFDVQLLGDAMEERGWHTDRQQLPPSLHMMVTPAHEQVVDRYLADLEEAAAETAKNPPDSRSGMAAIYGMVADMPDGTVARELILDFLGQMLRDE